MSTQETAGSTQETTLTSKERVILLLKANPKMTLSEVTDLIGLTMNGVKKNTDTLHREGILSRKGSTKAGEWIVNKPLTE